MRTGEINDFTKSVFVCVCESMNSFVHIPVSFRSALPLGTISSCVVIYSPLILVLNR